MKAILLTLIVVFMSSCNIALKSSTSNQKPLLVIPTGNKNMSIKVNEKVAVDFKKQNKSIEFFWFR